MLLNAEEARKLSIESTTFESIMKFDEAIKLIRSAASGGHEHVCCMCSCTTVASNISDKLRKLGFGCTTVSLAFGKQNVVIRW